MPSPINGGRGGLSLSGGTSGNIITAASASTIQDSGVSLSGLNITSIHDGTDATKIEQFDVSGITTGTTRTTKFPDSNTSLPIASQFLTFTGPTAARTITLPDAAFTVARTDAANTFTGHQTIEGVTSTGSTGTGNLVFSITPTLTGSPVVGGATFSSSAATALNSVTAAASTDLTLNAGSGNQNVEVAPTGTGIFEIRNGSNNQTLNLYHSYTNGSSYERLRITTVNTGNIDFVSENQGGVTDNFRFNSGSHQFFINNVFKAQFDTGGNLIWNTDNSQDIGASGATRPRTGYFGTSVVTPRVAVGSSNSVNVNGIRHGVSGAMSTGSVTVTDAGCTSNTRYFFTTHTIGTVTVPSSYYASTRNAGTSFVITSSQPTDTSTVDWLAIEP